MSLRVLHIFSPSLKTRFGGQNITWKNNFSQWSDISITHLVLDNQANRIIRAKEAFDFNYPSKQSNTTAFGRFFWIPSLLRNLVKFRSQYDILHFHVLWWGSLLAAYWAQRYCIPSIYESILLDADTPGSIAKEKFGKLKLKLLKSFSGIITISPFLKADYINNGFNEDKTFLLINSVESMLFLPLDDPEKKNSVRKKFHMSPDNIVLLFVGSMIHRKGFDLLVRSFEKIQKLYPQCRLLLVGPRNRDENPSLDEAYINNQLDWLAARDIADKVSLLGLVNDRNDLAQIYQASDLFVFPSRMEGLGNVVLEAMASGLPIVVSNLPVLKGIIADHKNGLIVAMEDVDAITEAVIHLIKSPNLAQTIAHQARSDALLNFSFPKWEADLVSIYRQVYTASKD